MKLVMLGLVVMGMMLATGCCSMCGKKAAAAKGTAKPHCSCCTCEKCECVDCSCCTCEVCKCGA